MATTPFPQASPALPAESSDLSAALRDLSTQVGLLAQRIASRGGDPAQQAASALAPADEGLFQTLRKWRADKARAEALPPYIIASDATLRAVATQRPKEHDALANVRGFGPKKVESYGDEIIAVVNAS